MPHKPGAHLGGVRTLEELRERCVIVKGSDCWHFRNADGKRPQAGQTLRIWSCVHGYAISARRLAYMLGNPGQALPKTWVVFDNCEEPDCINPEHLNRMAKGAFVKLMARQGKMSTARKSAATRLSGAKRSKVSPEVWGWVMESSQTNVDVAHAVGVWHTHIAQKRKKHRASFLGSSRC